MDAFESLVGMLLRHNGYWVTPSYKVNLGKEDKKRIGRPSAPRWELDLLAYCGSTNTVLAVECKSYLDSKGVEFVAGAFTSPTRYKLFTDPQLWAVVEAQLKKQLLESGAVRAEPQVTLCLAVGKFARNTDQVGIQQHFERHKWKLFTPAWLKDQLTRAATKGYENDVAFVVSKILLR